MMDALKCLGWEVKSLDSSSSLKTLSSAFGKLASLTWTNFGESCGLIREVEGPVVKLIDDCLLEDMENRDEVGAVSRMFVNGALLKKVIQVS